MMRRLLWFGLALLLLAGCVPVATQQGVATVAVINAPGETRVAGLAEAFEEALRQLPAFGHFELASSAAVRFQEVRRDMFGSRAVDNSARLARALGAELAVMVSAPIYRAQLMTVRGTFGDQLVAEREVQLEARVVDAATSDVLATVISRTFRDSEAVPDDYVLPRPEDDELLLELRDDAVADLAPHLLAVIDNVLAER